MVSKLSQFGIGLVAAFSATAGYVYLDTKDNFLNDSQLIEHGIRTTSERYQGTNISCAPLGDLSKFTEENDRQEALTLINDLESVPTGHRLLNDTRSNLFEDIAFCFADDLNNPDRDGVTNGFHTDTEHSYLGIPYYSVTVITLRRREHNQMLSDLGHEFAHRERSSLLSNSEYKALSASSQTLVRLSSEAFARATEVEVALQFERLNNSSVLSENYSGCESSETCTNNMIRAYLDNNDAPVYHTMLTWLTPSNVEFYNGLNIANVRDLSAERTSELKCEAEAIQLAPDFGDVDIQDRDLIARYIRSTSQSFQDRLQPSEYKQANTIIRQTLRSAAIAQHCNSDGETTVSQITPSAVSVPAQP